MSHDGTQLFGRLSGRSFVRYKNLKNGKMMDTTLTIWESIQVDKRRREQFEFIEVIELDKGAVPVAKEGSVEAVPVIEDDLECPICGFVAVDDNELQAHKGNHNGQEE